MDDDQISNEKTKQVVTVADINQNEQDDEKQKLAESHKISPKEQQTQEPMFETKKKDHDLPMNIKDVESMDPKNLMSKVMELSRLNCELENENKLLKERLDEAQKENTYLIKNANEEINQITEAVDNHLTR